VKPKEGTIVSLEESVQALCTNAQKLNSLTDRLNEKLADAERRMRDAGVGIELWLDDVIDVAGENPVKIGWYDNGGWSLVFAYLDDDGHRAKVVDLISASRAVRIAAFPHVLVLIERLQVEVASALERFSHIEGELDGSPPQPARVVRRAAPGGGGTVRRAPSASRDLPPPITDDDIPF
jgi:hypothetical protein